LILIRIIGHCVIDPWVMLQLGAGLHHSSSPVSQMQAGLHFDKSAARRQSPIFQARPPN